MKKLIIALTLLLITSPAHAAFRQISGMFQLTPPTSLSVFIGLYCEDDLMIEDATNGNIYKQMDCAGTPHNDLYLTPTVMSLFNKTSMAAIASAIFTGTASQVVHGDGSVGSITITSNDITDATTVGKSVLTASSAANARSAIGAGTSNFSGAYSSLTGAPTVVSAFTNDAGYLTSVGSRTFNYPSRALNSCFQISSTKDADFHYKVDVSSGTLLSGTATGTVTATTYTNSGCTTGAQAVADGNASQGAALGILSVSQIISISLDGTEPAGKWLKITTAQTAGTPTFAIRSVQSEVIQP